MTRAEILALTVKRCDERFEEELTRTEILLLDLGGTAEEIEAAIGPDGFCRKMLQADRDQQIAAVARWLAIGSATLH